MLSSGDKLYDYFTGQTSNVSFFSKYLKEGCCSGLDLTKSYLYAARVPESFKIEEIQNNGAGIGVFYYDDSSSNNSLLLEILKEDNNRLILLMLLNQAKKERKLPLIIKLKLSVFKSLPVSVPGREDAMRKLEHGLGFCFSFLKSSSIWIRITDVDDGFDLAKDEFNWFKSLRLYDFNSAMEFFDYNVRTQKENYLVESGGHGTHITPMIYSDETTYRDFFLEDDSAGFPFKFLGDENKADFKTHDVAMRILLVDDKIGRNSENDNCNICCNICKGCHIKPDSNKGEPCKLKVISKLLSGEFVCEEKQNIFKKRTYWSALKLNETGGIVGSNVKSYVVDKVVISDIWKLSQDGSKLVSNNEDLKNFINETNCVQIIGVCDLESALVLMSCCKFDIILLDYLLGKRSDTDDERYYSTELFEFLSYDFGKREMDDPDVIKMLRKNNKINGEDFPRLLLKQFRDEVKLNRGPLDKYWIVPMTSYNPSFIADLQRRNVRLIDHRWNISQGADPVNTPWHFLYKINEFVDLQLRSSVFRLDTLLLFLKYTCEDCAQLKPKDGEDTVGFYDFQAFMGAEYANFMRRYGNRQMLRRDAAISFRNDIDADKSVFATCVWKHFYAHHEYRDVIELNRLIRSFLHHASVMHNDGDGQQRLEETFGQLSFFIDTNQKVKNTISDFEDLKGLDKKMMSLRKIIDCVTDHSDNKKDNKKKTQ